MKETALESDYHYYDLFVICGLSMIGTMLMLAGGGGETRKFEITIFFKKLEQLETIVCVNLLLFLSCDVFSSKDIKIFWLSSIYIYIKKHFCLGSWCV